VLILALGVASDHIRFGCDEAREICGLHPGGPEVRCCVWGGGGGGVVPGNPMAALRPRGEATRHLRSVEHPSLSADIAANPSPALPESLCWIDITPISYGMLLRMRAAPPHRLSLRRRWLRPTPRSLASRCGAWCKCLDQAGHGHRRGRRLRLLGGVRLSIGVDIPAWKVRAILV